MDHGKRAFAVYWPKHLNNPRTNYLRKAENPYHDTLRSARDSRESERPGAVILHGMPSSFELELAKPAVNELAGYDVPVRSPLSCACISLARCTHFSICPYGCVIQNCDHVRSREQGSAHLPVAAAHRRRPEILGPPVALKTLWGAETD